MKGLFLAAGMAVALVPFAQDAIRLSVNPDPAEGPPTAEHVRVHNESLQAIDLGLHRICDAIGTCFAIPGGTTLLPGDSITLVTGRGTDAEGLFYWGRAVAVWNNTGDVALLLDSAGQEVTRLGYGDQPAVRVPGLANPAPTPRPQTSAPPPRRTCCRICRTGKACGNSCISRSYTCRQPPGCACNGGDEEFFAELLGGIEISDATTTWAGLEPTSFWCAAPKPLA